MPAGAQRLKSGSPSDGFPTVIRSTILAGFPEVICGLSTRNGGVSPEPYGMNTSFHVNDSPDNVAENRGLFLGALGVQPGTVAIPQQRHTAVVMTVNAAGAYPECDALVTNVPNVYLCVSVADCAPVFLFDKAKRVVACVHAGWRGTARKIVRNAVVRMEEEFGTNAIDVVAFIGPSAGRCCYEVGEEVAKEFEEQLVRRGDGKMYLDIPGANSIQLRAAGVPESNIEVQGECTICNSGMYHSYRRDRKMSGRMMGVIGLRQ